MKEEKLCCPKCRNKLMLRSNEYYCGRCQSHFPIIQKIPILLPEIRDKATLSDIAAWNDKGSGRIEHTYKSKAILQNKEPRIRDFKDHSKNIDFHGRVLEIGGGVCWASLIIKSMYPSCKVYATDIAFSALLKAKEIAETLSIKIDKYMAVDVQSSPFPNDYFDVIIGMEVLHHIPNLLKGLTEIHRILKSNGVYFGMGEGAATRPMQYLTSWLEIQGSEVKKYRIQEKVYTLREWENYFINAGFNEVNISICKGARYRYHFGLYSMYYLIISHIPNSLVSKLLGSEIHIKAKK